MVAVAGRRGPAGVEMLARTNWPTCSAEICSTEPSRKPLSRQDREANFQGAAAWSEQAPDGAATARPVSSSLASLDLI